MDFAFKTAEKTKPINLDLYYKKLTFLWGFNRTGISTMAKYFPIYNEERSGTLFQKDKYSK